MPDPMKVLLAQITYPPVYRQGEKMVQPTPTPKTGVTAATVAKDVTLYGGILVAILSVLANVPAFGTVFAASGPIQAVVDALIAVVTAIFSIRAQNAVAAAKAEAVK